MRKVYDIIVVWLQRVSKVMGIIAAFVLALMMLLTVVDVIGRYFFNRPIKGTWELVGLLLVCAGTWGMAYCQMEKAHINITILLDNFSRKTQVVLQIFTCLIGFIGFGVISWQTYVLGASYFIMTRGNVTDTLGLPYAPFLWMLSIGAGMMALILIVDIINSFIKVVRT